MDVRSSLFRPRLIPMTALVVSLIGSAWFSARTEAGCGDYMVRREIRTGWRLFVHTEHLDRALQAQRDSAPKPCTGPTCRQSPTVPSLPTIPQQENQRWEAITTSAPADETAAIGQRLNDLVLLTSSLYVARIDRPPQ